jgi:GDP-4-dehydro-6-deoxy-D-mannose reductase
MRAVITGAGGFVGYHLAEHLRAEGDDVVGLDVVERPGIQAVDITDFDAVRSAMEAAAPDAVYHLAALSHVGESWRDFDELMQVNVDGTRHVVEAAHQTGATRMIIVGSAEEYGAAGRSHSAVGEDAALLPLSPYGASKVAAEFAAQAAFIARGAGVIRVRAFSHTGPGQSARFVVPAFARRIVEAGHAGADHIMVGNVETVRDFTDVRDIVRAYRLLVERGRPGEAYNVASGVGVSIREIAERLMRLAGVSLRLERDPDLDRPADVPLLVGDAEKLHRDTGWTREVDLDDTLAAVLTDVGHQPA